MRALRMILNRNQSSRSSAPVLICVILLAACQPTAGGPPSLPGTSPAEEAGPIDVELVLGPGNFDLIDPNVGLADLSSYKATLTVTFDGSQNGEPFQWASAYTMLHIKEPLARLLTIENSGDLSPDEPAVMAEADGAAYEIGPDGKCTADNIDPDSSLIDWLQPAGLLGGLLGAEEAGQETVEGVAADHYIFDERAMAEFGLAETDGEIWVATEGSYVLRYQRTTTGNTDYFHQGIEGIVIWDYELTDIDQPLELIFPEGCRVEAPPLPDATNLMNLPGWLSFDTAVSVAEAAAFYQEQLPGLGWTQLSEPVFSDASAVLEYTQGDQTMNVLIATGDAGTDVDILVTIPEQ